MICDPWLVFAGHMRILQKDYASITEKLSERGKKEIVAKLYYVSDIQTCTKQSMTNLCSSAETTEDIKHP